MLIDSALRILIPGIHVGIPIAALPLGRPATPRPRVVRCVDCGREIAGQPGAACGACFVAR